MEIPPPSSGQASPQFKRKPNWGVEESFFLLEKIKEKNVLGERKFSGPRSLRAAAWASVASEVNAAFPHTHRTAKDCEKRFHALKSKERQNISAHRRQFCGTGKKIVIVEGILATSITLSIMQIIILNYSQPGVNMIMM